MGREPRVCYGVALVGAMIVSLSLGLGSVPALGETGSHADGASASAPRRESSENYDPESITYLLRIYQQYLLQHGNLDGASKVSIWIKYLNANSDPAQRKGDIGLLALRETAKDTDIKKVLQQVSEQIISEQGRSSPERKRSLLRSQVAVQALLRSRAWGEIPSVDRGSSARGAGLVPSEREQANIEGAPQRELNALDQLGDLLKEVDSHETAHAARDRKGSTRAKGARDRSRVGEVEPESNETTDAPSSREPDDEVGVEKSTSESGDETLEDETNDNEDQQEQEDKAPVVKNVAKKVIIKDEMKKLFDRLNSRMNASSEFRDLRNTTLVYKYHLPPGHTKAVFSHLDAVPVVNGREVLPPNSIIVHYSRIHGNPNGPPADNLYFYKTDPRGYPITEPRRDPLNGQIIQFWKPIQENEIISGTYSQSLGLGGRKFSLNSKGEFVLETSKKVRKPVDDEDEDEEVVKPGHSDDEDESGDTDEINTEESEDGGVDAP